MIINHLLCVRHCARGGGGVSMLEWQGPTLKVRLARERTQVQWLSWRVTQERGRQNCFESSKEREISPGWRGPFRPIREIMCERGLDKAVGFWWTEMRWERQLVGSSVWLVCRICLGGIRTPESIVKSLECQAKELVSVSGLLLETFPYVRLGICQYTAKMFV